MRPTASSSDTFLSPWRTRKMIFLWSDASGPRAEDPFEALSSLEQEAALEKLLEKIPRCNRVTLKLFSQDYTYREIAQKMGVPAGTVMSRLHRARAQLEKARAGCSPDVTARALPSRMKLNST